jgi:hypothetical protein
MIDIIFLGYVTVAYRMLTCRWTRRNSCWIRLLLIMAHSMNYAVDSLLALG